MRILNAAVGAVLLILVASPAFAGDPRGGGRSGGGQHVGGACGGGCGGGHPTPPPPPPSHGCGGGCGYGGNINVNVNANASANAWAGASAGGHFNARAYDVGGIRGRGYGGGTVYVGGGYGGDGGGCYGGCGGAIYNEEVYEGRTCASAPFGYVVGGFGRQGRRPPACVGGGATCRGDDRGGRYGYSEDRGCGGGRREDDHDVYGASGGSYESYESYEEYDSWSGGYREEDYGYEDRGGSYGGSYGGDCGCRRDDHGEAPYPPPYLPEPPRHYEPSPPARPHRPDRPRPSHPPRQHYSQEPGERG